MIERINDHQDAERIKSLQEYFEESFCELLRQKKPSQVEIMRAARAFNDFATETLRQAGYKSTKSVVADVVGEARPHYYQVLTGRRGSAERISHWFAIWTLTWSSLSFPQVDKSSDPSRAHGRETLLQKKQRELLAKFHIKPLSTAK